MCEPSVSGQTLHSYSGTAGATQQKSIKHSGESPSVTFIIITKKNVVMMCLLRHGPGQRVFFILSKGRKWVIDFLYSQTGARDWLVEWALASQYFNFVLNRESSYNPNYFYNFWTFQVQKYWLPVSLILWLCKEYSDFVSWEIGVKYGLQKHMESLRSHCSLTQHQHIFHIISHYY